MGIVTAVDARAVVDALAAHQEAVRALAVQEDAGSLGTERDVAYARRRAEAAAAEAARVLAAYVEGGGGRTASEAV
jgi:hypothetical protein